MTEKPFEFVEAGINHLKINGLTLVYCNTYEIACEYRDRWNEKLSEIAVPRSEHESLEKKYVKLDELAEYMANALHSAVQSGQVRTLAFMEYEQWKKEAGK